MKGKYGILSLLTYPNILTPLAWRKALSLFPSSIKALTPFPVLLHIRDVPFCVTFAWLNCLTAIMRITEFKNQILPLRDKLFRLARQKQKILFRK